MPKTLIKKQLNIEKDDFFKAVNIFIFNPHVVNRKLNAISNIFALRLSGNFVENLHEKLKHFSTIEEINQLLSGDIEIIDHLGDSLNYHEDEDDHQSAGYLLLNKLIPRNLQIHKTIQAFTLVDLKLNKITFIDSLKDNVVNQIAPAFTYSIQFKDSVLSITVEDDEICVEANSTKFIDWLRESLFPKLVKWSENRLEKEINIKSNKQVDAEEYATLYASLKHKYGPNLIQNWKESTDPYKFVYEDIAIATYLILIWRQERSNNNTTKLQSFVDLGCGNGLLVYILSSEGHDGFGIDLRKRKIWDTFPASTVLKIQSIVPSNHTLFPDIDWIIGNHSDELSPWIPVIAARSSYTSRFFLLPCCAFEFSGKKYQRVNCKLSQYMDFIDYVIKVSKDICGFSTTVDRLKIPSTKRICVIGQNRNYDVSEYENVSLKIEQFVSCRDTEKQDSSDNWNKSFVPRNIVEEVKNCSQIDNSIADDIVKLVFNQILSKRRYDPDFLKPNWNLGGVLHIGDVVKLIAKDKLKFLKSECGGLKTLLKNNYQIFIVENGEIRIRLPTKLDDKMKLKHPNAKPLRYKQKNCWFFINHPDGCPLEDFECSYKH